MPRPTERPPGFLMALWFSFIGFIGNLFNKSPSSNSLPIPVTAVKPTTTTISRPTAASVRVTHERISVPYNTRVPLKRPTSAASSPILSTARSATPKRAISDPSCIFHPPPSPFPNISLSGIFTTSPLLASPRLELLSLPSSPQVQPSSMSPGSLSLSRDCHASSSPSFHTLHSRSPRTPRTPSSAVLVQLDRSTISPTTMSDGSLEVISLGDRRGFVGSPVKIADFGRLPSPWSPVGKSASSDVWLSVDGTLTNATGPVVDNATRIEDDSVAPRTAMLSLSRISTTSLYSSSSALDALGISLFVDLDEVGNKSNIVNTSDDPTNVPKLNQVSDVSYPTFITHEPQTPRKRRETLPFVVSHMVSQSARTTKCLSTPLTKLDNVGVGHVRSATSISSMAYELRMGLFADGRSMTAFENIISLLDQASPESMPPHNDTMQPVVTG